MLPPQEEQAIFAGGSNGHSDRAAYSGGRNGGALVPMGMAYEAPEVPAVGWTAPPLQRPPALTAGPSALGLLAALQRRWLLSTALGLVVGGIVAGLCWYFMPAKREVASCFLVAMEKPSVLFPEKTGPDEFATYKRSQAELITNSFVLNAALRNQDVANLPMVRALITSSDDVTDQINYLTKNVAVTFPGDATLMRVSMWGNDPVQLKTLIDSIGEAYLKEVVNKDQVMRQARYTSLEDMLRRNRAELTKMREKIASLAESTGSPDSEVVKRRIERLDRDLLTTHEEYIIAQRHANDLEMQVALTAAKLQQAQKESPIVTEAMIDQYLRGNEEYTTMTQQVGDLRRAYEDRRSRTPSGENKILAGMRVKFEQLQEQIAQLRAQSRAELLVAMKEERVAQLTNELSAYNTERELRRQHVKTVATRLEQLNAQAQSLSTKSFELTQRVSELEQLEEVTNKIATEYEQLKIELGSPPRVQIFEKALPQGDNSFMRKTVVAFSGLLGMLLTMFGVSLVEFQARRLGNVDQVSEGLGLKVIGVLPHLSGRGISRMVGRNNSVRGMLAESIDGIRSAILHSDRSDSLRVILVTSSLGHEGKTTLATQLAASLARAGRRTLLIDGDLRNPTAHRLLEQPLEPGLSEVLRSEVELDDVIRPTRAAGMWMISAGKVCRECVHALAKDSMRALFAKLRRDFDYIVIDSAPVLSTADTLSLGQHADGVVISVLRSVSRAGKVYEACDRLESVGIPVLGAVVNGVDTPLLRRLPEVPGTPGADGEAKPAPPKKPAKVKKAKA